jgi:hypothetical protein
MNFVISMIPITNTELAVLTHGGHPTARDGSDNWMADAQAQRAFAGQSLREQSYSPRLMQTICAALGIPQVGGLPENKTICLSAHELAAACSRYQSGRLLSMDNYSVAFVDQCANTVCAALVHWCPHVYIVIDLIGD